LRFLRYLLIDVPPSASALRCGWGRERGRNVSGFWEERRGG
jgi:hypothetical protein